MANETTTKAIIQASAFYDHHGPSLVRNQPESPEKASGPAKNLTVSNSSSVSSPSSTNSNGVGYHLSEEAHSMLSYKPAYSDSVHASGSLLSFEYPIWAEDMHTGSYQNQLISPTSTAATAYGVAETSGSHHAAATGYGGALSNGVHFAWPNDQQEADTINKASSNKRSSMGENMQALKKQCVVTSSNCASKKLKLKSESSSNDPQSIAAKNRRERISERLKVLQELVPNGSKVDMVTMLEKAISYVKFLQLQVKVLATDEFWPAQGGKAPDLSQVKETIDAILLASQRDRNSTSK